MGVDQSFGKTKDPDYIAAVITLTARENVRAEGNEDLFAALVYSKVKVERMAPVGTRAIDLAYTEDSLQTGLHFRSAADGLNALEQTGLVDITPEIRSTLDDLSL